MIEIFATTLEEISLAELSVENLQRLPFIENKGIISATCYSLPKINSHRIKLKYQKTPCADEDYRITQYRIAMLRQQATIAHFSLDKTLRSQGNGRALYLTIEKLLEQLGCKKIELFSLTNAEPFWEKMGFITTPEDKMEKILA